MVNYRLQDNFLPSIIEKYFRLKIDMGRDMDI
jgi:hypothetical protein